MIYFRCDRCNREQNLAMLKCGCETDSGNVSSTGFLSVKVTEIGAAIEEMNRHIENLKEHKWSSEDLSNAREHRDKLITGLIQLQEYIEVKDD